MVEHPDCHVQLLASFCVPHEPGDRRVDREDDVVLPREGAEPLGELVVHPEPALEVDLAGREPAFEQRFDGRLGALARRHTRRPEVKLSCHLQEVTSDQASTLPPWPHAPHASICSSSTSICASPTSGGRPPGSRSGRSKSSPPSCVPRTARGTATRSLRS